MIAIRVINHSQVCSYSILVAGYLSYISFLHHHVMTIEEKKSNGANCFKVGGGKNNPYILERSLISEKQISSIN